MCCNEVRRRQGDPRRHGPVAEVALAGRRRHGHHQRADPRLVGRRQGGRGPARRAHRRHRQGRKPRHAAGRYHRRRTDNGGDRGRGQDPDRRLHRQPRPLHLPPAGRRGPRLRDHDHAGRRHRPGHGHQRHHLHAGALAHPRDALGGRGVPDEPRLPRQGQRGAAGAAARAGARGRDGPQAARGLGHHAGGDQQLPRRRRRDGRAGGDPHRHAERVGLRRDLGQGDEGMSSAAMVSLRMRDSANATSSAMPGSRWWHTISMSRCSATVFTV